MTHPSPRGRMCYAGLICESGCAENMNTDTRGMETSIVRAAGLGVLVVGVVVALSVMIPLRNQLQENVKLELMHAVDARASVVEQYLSRVSDIALQITSRTRARQALESYNKGLSSRAEFIKLSAPILQDAISRSADGIGILRFDNQGRLAVSVGATPAPDFRDWPGENLTRARVDGPLEFDGRTILTVAAPILDSSATRIGTDIVVFDASSLKAIIANREQSASIYRLFLLADSDEIPALIVASHAGHQDPGNGRIITGDVQQALLATRQDRSAPATAFVTVTDTAVIAYARIPGMPWTLALAQDASIVNAPIHRQLLAVGLLIVALIGLGIVGIWRVIRPLTRQLSENRIFLDAVLDNMQEGVVACDADGVLSYFNKATAAFHGKAVSQLPPQEWSAHFDLFHADGKTLMGVDEVPLYRTFQGEEIEGFEMVIAPKQGERRFVICNGQQMRDTNGHRLGAVATMHDISRSKAAEFELRESEQRFRGAFDSAAHGIALVARDGHWLKVNKSLCEMLGYDETELLRTDFQSLTHPDDLQTGLRMARQLIANEIQSYHLEKRYLHKRGRWVWTMLSVSLVHNDSGEPLHFVLQIQDLTAQKENIPLQQQ